MSTSYTLTGHMGETQVSFTWTDGNVMSDHETALLLLQAQAEALEGHPVRMSGCRATTHEHLSDPNSAYEVMQMCFTDVGRITAGQMPQFDPLPEHVVV